MVNYKPVLGGMFYLGKVVFMTHNYSQLTDREIADRLAKGMGFHLEDVTDPVSGIIFQNWVDANGVGKFDNSEDSWNPCQDYNHCRIVEEFVRCKMPSIEYEFDLELEKIIDEENSGLTSTARQRCEAALAVIESK